MATTTVTVELDVGDWLDVMDSEGTWNVAQIMRFPSEKEVLVKYEGWGDEFNEVVLLNSERVAPYDTYTWSVRCWAKYKNWPWWPSIVTIRSLGTIAGQQYLVNEKRLFVDFLDNSDIKKRCRCWVDLSNITPFDVKFDERRKRTSGAVFDAAFTSVLKSTASSDFPKFKKGTLPVMWSSIIADSVEKMKRGIGMADWMARFNSNQIRHQDVYVYNTSARNGVAVDVDRDAEDAFNIVNVGEGHKPLPDAVRGKPTTGRTTNKEQAPKGKSKTKDTTGMPEGTASIQAVTGEVFPAYARREDEPVPPARVQGDVVEPASSGHGQGSVTLISSGLPTSDHAVDATASRKRKTDTNGGTTGSTASSKKRLPEELQLVVNARIAPTPQH